MECFKTKKCKFYEEGRCNRGSLCTFAHEDFEIRLQPDLSKTRICTDWRHGKCSGGDRCSFAHGSEELRSNESCFKTSMCSKRNHRGGCKTPNCPYAHSESELRTLRVTEYAVVATGSGEGPVEGQGPENGSTEIKNGDLVVEGGGSCKGPMQAKALRGKNGRGGGMRGAGHRRVGMAHGQQFGTGVFGGQCGSSHREREGFERHGRHGARGEVHHSALYRRTTADEREMGVDLPSATEAGGSSLSGAVVFSAELPLCDVDEHELSERLEARLFQSGSRVRALTGSPALDLPELIRRGSSGSAPQQLPHFPPGHPAFDVASKFRSYSCTVDDGKDRHFARPFLPSLNSISTAATFAPSISSQPGDEQLSVDSLPVLEHRVSEELSIFGPNSGGATCLPCGVPPLAPGDVELGRPCLDVRCTIESCRSISNTDTDLIAPVDYQSPPPTPELTPQQDDFSPLLTEVNDDLPSLQLPIVGSAANCISEVPASDGAVVFEDGGGGAVEDWLVFAMMSGVTFGEHERSSVVSHPPPVSHAPVSWASAEPGGIPFLSGRDCASDAFTAALQSCAAESETDECATLEGKMLPLPPPPPFLDLRHFPNFGVPHEPSSPSALAAVCMSGLPTARVSADKQLPFLPILPSPFLDSASPSPPPTTCLFSPTALSASMIPSPLTVSSPPFTNDLQPSFPSQCPPTDPFFLPGSATSSSTSFGNIIPISPLHLGPSSDSAFRSPAASRLPAASLSFSSPRCSVVFPCPELHTTLRTLTPAIPPGNWASSSEIDDRKRANDLPRTPPLFPSLFPTPLTAPPGLKHFIPSAGMLQRGCESPFRAGDDQLSKDFRFPLTPASCRSSHNAVAGTPSSFLSEIFFIAQTPSHAATVLMAAAPGRYDD